MLDITSFRRKQKYVQPITIMRQFYHDTRTRQNSIIKNNNRLNQFNDTDPLFRRTLSVDKFTKYIQDNSDANIDVKKCVIKQTEEEERTKKITSSKLNDSINNGNKYCIRKQSGCFQSIFSNTIGLFDCHRAIKNRIKSQNVDKNDKQNIQKNQKPQIPNILFSRRKLQIRNPSKLYSQMCETKASLEINKKVKKQNFKKLRQTWIINNLYKHSQFQIPKTASLKSKYRIRQIFSSTQQNLFPKAQI